jgi:nicotinate phosphoribosyltransferase
MAVREYKDLYNSRMGLLTDLYQLTMAQAYHHAGTANHEAVFHLSFRNAPFDGGYAIACGIQTVLDRLLNFGFSPDDISYLGTVCGNDDKPIFRPDFLDRLREKLVCTVDAVSEGTIVFPHEPIVRVQGPLWQCQLVETMLLNTINFETLIATKASRMCHAAKLDTVAEFGLRRAQGPDGGISASRAAYIGGCMGTSNVLAGKLFGIPVVGTHAHSWVMSFDEEKEAFERYAEAMPNNCILLVDTYDTIEGVRKAIEVGEALRKRGHALGGIRLDSGDLVQLSIEARELLDTHGFKNTAIVASNDLDEYLIASMQSQGAVIDTWGVGTKLITAHDQPALGGVYKLSLLRKGKAAWQYKMKLSNNPEKVSIPGKLQVKRFYNGSKFIGDLIVDEVSEHHSALKNKQHGAKAKLLGAPGTIDLDPKRDSHIELLTPLIRNGECVSPSFDIHYAKKYVDEQLAEFPYGMRRFYNPAYYPVALEASLHNNREILINKLRAENESTES